MLIRILFILRVCRFAVLPFCHFAVLAFKHVGILPFRLSSMSAFLPFCRFAILVFCHFAILVFWHFAILVFWHSGSPQVFEGHPFVVEAGVSLGGKQVKAVRNQTHIDTILNQYRNSIETVLIQQHILLRVHIPTFIFLSYLYAVHHLVCAYTSICTLSFSPSCSRFLTGRGRACQRTI